MFIKALNLNLKLCSQRLVFAWTLMVFGAGIYLTTHNTSEDSITVTIFVVPFSVCAFYQFIRGFRQLYADSLDGEEAYGIMTLPLSSKDMIMGKIVAGGFWIALFSGTAFFLLYIRAYGLGIHGVQTFLYNLVDDFIIRGNSPLSVGLIFFLIPIGWMIYCHVASVAILAVLEAVGKRKAVFRSLLCLIAICLTLGCGLTIFSLFQRLAWMISSLLLMVCSLCFMVGIWWGMTLYCYGHLEKHYDLR